MFSRFDTTEKRQISEALGCMIIAHQGQMYGDAAYFHHPIEVADTVKDADAVEIVAALLHDTVEDTYVTMTDINEKFGTEVADIVKLLTKDDSMSYKENIERIINSGNVGAMKVKLADNRVNSGGDKSHMTTARRLKLNSRYAMSIEMLETALN